MFGIAAVYCGAFITIGPLIFANLIVAVVVTNLVCLFNLNDQGLTVKGSII
jgi:hypothetical protein